ncbi:MAG: alpha/beta hydrolase [Myxococcales bacterium]|nr:alpha/beta hydrolase [Myxococcales bacterium]MCB9732073.1 alpha/beta hydrolase [Deltaproteobacteria bacterium]
MTEHERRRILDHPVLSGRLFFPQSEPPPDVTWVDVPGARLACHHAVHDPAWPTIVHFHGNGEVVADHVPELVDLARAARANLFLAEYRGYGGSTGQPAVATLLSDVPHVIRALGLPPARLIAFGRSLGSLLAIHATAMFSRLGGLVLESAIADPLERLLARVQPWELDATHEAVASAVETVLGHERKVRAYEGQVLVLHARHDDIVDASHAERLYAWSDPDRARLVLLPFGDHNSVMFANRRAYGEALAELVAAVAAAGASATSGASVKVARTS